MLFKAAHVMLYGLCFAGFMSQCWELLIKFSKGLTTMSILNTLPSNGGLDLPRISICPDPPFSQTRLSELGLSQESWDVNQFSTDYQGTTQWPITSEDDSNLYDQSTHSFQEVVQTAVFVESQKKALRLDQKQYYKETNTWYNGKCFTFLLEGISATTESLLRIDLKHVFGNETGRFKMFIHDHGMEMALVNQINLSSPIKIQCAQPLISQKA
ncbi:uncharacterized protein LOC131889933 isoform X2 [Tigriopus californicus]|uniref:uncharacterized protein LOC131889933 isoform X2 n=1 Tax=Tigriopus californicus TaxID=6832 RepID=UPI0027DA9D82|nr:uncharacterized protein LOC131889933 isoform X2 [Tigriopus californicus]